MDSALDKRTNKLINASNARSILFRSFVCPICREAVHLRDGPKRVAYFAHNVARQDCELSFLSIYKAGTYHAATLDRESLIGDFQLGLRLYVNSRPMSWGLELDLGVKDISDGQVVIDVGGRETTADLTGNRLSNYLMVVEPQRAAYRVVSVVPHRSQAAIFEGKTCDGLRSTGMSAFTAVGRAGHALFYRAEKIEGGRTYVVVWPSGNSALFPDDFECELLETRDGFTAALVIVPKLLSETELEWIRINLHLNAENRIQRIVQVWPPITNRITSQSVQSVRNDAIVVGIDDNDAHQSASVFVRCEGEVRAAGGIPGAKTLFRYEPEGKPTARLLTTDGSGAMLDVEFSLLPTTTWHALNATVVLRTTSGDGASTSIPLHSRYAAKVLLDVRHGHAKMDCISMPRAGQGRMLVGQGDAAIEHYIRATSKAVAGQKYGFHPSDEDFALFVDSVCKPDLNVIIDFGAFGHISLPAMLAPKCQVEVAGISRLPAKVRALLKNYLFRLGSPAVWPRPDTRMSDWELVSAFKSGRRKGGDAAISRYLEREVSRYVDGITK